MKHQTNIQSSRFDENETDHLIHTYGTKVSPEKWRDIQAVLAGQKDQFIELERSRADDRERGR